MNWACVPFLIGFLFHFHIYSFSASSAIYIIVKYKSRQNWKLQNQLQPLPNNGFTFRSVWTQSQFNQSNQSEVSRFYKQNRLTVIINITLYMPKRDSILKTATRHGQADTSRLIQTMKQLSGLTWKAQDRRGIVHHKITIITLVTYKRLNKSAKFCVSNPFNGPFPGLPRWAGTRKVKPIWILMNQETVSGSGISWAVCKFAPHHSVFYRPDALPAAQPTASKQWRNNWRVTARCVLSVVILPITTQQCRNYLHDKSWPNRWYEVGGLVKGNVS